MKPESSTEMAARCRREAIALVERMESPQPTPSRFWPGVFLGASIGASFVGVLVRSGLLLCLLAVSALAGSVTLAWDANPPGDNVISYRLHLGNTAGGPYVLPVDVGNVLTYTFTRLAPGRYYAVATAFSATGQSEYSSEVTFVIQPDPGPLPGTPTGLRVLP